MIGLLNPIVRPVIVTDRDLRSYVLRVAIVCIGVALALDVASQLAFFTDWATALRSWTLTVIDAVICAVPISILIGRSQRELYHAKLKFEQLSHIDVLTGLPNRRAIMDCVRKREWHIMVLMIVDIDRFKAINDTFGHLGGDTVIRAVGQRLTSELRDAELVGRLGGEEFAVLAPASAAESLLASLDMFRANLAASPLMADGRAIEVTISAGAAIREPGEPFETLYSEADRALYLAKASGRNRIECSPRLRDLWWHGTPKPSRDAA